MKTIIALVVFLISVIAYFSMRKNQRKDSIASAIRIKSELREKLSELRVLQTNLLPIYGSEKVLRTMADKAGEDYKLLQNAAKDFQKQVIESDELGMKLNDLKDDDINTADLQEIIIHIDEMIRDYRYRLKHMPSEVRDVLRGEN